MVPAAYDVNLTRISGCGKKPLGGDSIYFRLFLLRDFLLT